MMASEDHGNSEKWWSAMGLMDNVYGRTVFCMRRWRWGITFIARLVGYHLKPIRLLNIDHPDHYVFPPLLSIVSHIERYIKGWEQAYNRSESAELGDVTPQI